MTNKQNITVGLVRALIGADIFIGVSVADILTPEMVCSMAKNPIVFDLANPDSEIGPLLAKRTGIGIIAAGRRHYSNQVNNGLAFPGISRGAIGCLVKEINMDTVYAPRDTKLEWVKEMASQI